MFPTIEEWSKNVVHPNDTVIRSDLKNHYRYEKEKYDVALRLNPKKIIEIGVRLGYSAHAFLCACPNAEYRGLDMWGGEHGGTKIAGAEYVLEMLARNCPNAWVGVYSCNTQMQKWPDIPSAELFHVDGDHTTAGALNDMRGASVLIQKGGSMLVDDYDFLPEVRSAVEIFKQESAGMFARWEYLPTFRGDVLFTGRS